jgi:hypothetical protein
MQQETQKKAAMKNEIAAKKPNALAVSQDFSDGGWDTEVVDTKDILIPKILLMHPTSDLVKKGIRNIGEIIKSTTEEVIAKRGESLEVVVFEKWKEWRIMKLDAAGKRFEYVRTEAWTPENDDQPWDYAEGPDKFRRDKTMNFYGILLKDAEVGTAFPVKLSFTRTGFKTGLKIADAYTRAIMEKAAPTRQAFKIGSELKDGKDESYFAFTAGLGVETPDTVKEIALQWRKIVAQAKKNNAIADHEVDDEPVASKTQSTSTVKDF